MITNQQSDVQQLARICPSQILLVQEEQELTFRKVFLQQHYFLLKIAVITGLYLFCKLFSETL